MTIDSLKVKLRKRSDERFSPVELLQLYRVRRQVKPTRSQAARLMASMRWNQDPSLRLRLHELGWFWFRDWPKSQLGSLLKKVDTGQKQCDKAKAAQKPVASRRPEDREGLRRILERASTSTSGRLRADAVRKLATFRNSEDLPLIRKLAREDQYSVRWAVAEALGNLRRPDDVPLLKKLARKMSEGPALASLMGFRGNVAAAAIRELSQDKDGCLRGNLAVQLHEWQHKDAATVLRRLAVDKEPWPRCAAASSLGALRLAKDLPLLRRMTRDEDSFVRREAVWAVGLYCQPKDIALMQASTGDEAREVRMVAAMALTRIMARGALVRWMDENIDRVSFEVLRELDFALYAPGWLKRAEPRAGDNDIRLELGMCRPEDYAE